MKLKKRTKKSRLRGARTCGWGFRKKHRGSGHKGGKGMSGTGKRASQKQQKARMIAKAAGAESYFGKQGFTSRRTEKKINKVINLEAIKKNFFEKENAKIDLKDYKILGNGEGFKAEIIANSASKSAIEKMNKAGGKIIVEVRKERKDKPKVSQSKDDVKASSKQVEKKDKKEKVVKEKKEKKTEAKEKVVKEKKEKTAKKE